MITSKILKFVNFAKTEKFRYLENEVLFLQIKKFINYNQDLLYYKKSSFQWR